MEHCQTNYLDEESLNFIRIARSVNKIPEIVLNKNKIESEQALIEFYNSFDIFCNNFFLTMSKFEPVPETLAIKGSGKKSRNIDGNNSSTFFSSYKTKRGIFGNLSFSILAEHIFFFLDLSDI